MAPVNFSGTQEDYPGGPKFDYHLTAGLAEVAECLTDSTSDVPHKFNSYPVMIAYRITVTTNEVVSLLGAVVLVRRARV